MKNKYFSFLCYKSFFITLFVCCTLTSFGQSSFANLHSATDSVVVNSITNLNNWGRGFRFAPTQDIWVYKLGKRVPANGTFTWAIWEVSTQTKVLEQVSATNNPSTYIYEDADSIVKLNSGTQYILELYGVGSGYYYGNSSQIGQHLIYYDMRYCNSCNSTNFPTSSLSNHHYGIPDFLYSFTAPQSGPNNAGVSSIFTTSNPPCAGSAPLYAVVNNAGTNQIDTLTINWELNSTPQTPIMYYSLLDTLGGSGQTSDTVLLGNITLQPNVNENVLVYTTMPNNVVDTVTGNDSNVVNIQPALSGVYTVDATQPPSTTNFQSFTAATAALSQYGTCGNVYFNVAPNTYTGQAQIGAFASSNATDSVFFRGMGTTPGQTIIEADTTSSSANYVLLLSGANNLSFDNLTFNNNDPIYMHVLEVSGTTHDVQFDSCIFINDTVNNTSTSSNDVVIYRNGSGSVKNITFSNSQILGGSYGFYWYGNSGSPDSNIAFIGNQIIDPYYRGIYFYYQKDGKINDNYIQSNSTYSSGYAMYLYNSGVTSDIQIKGNHIDGAGYTWPSDGMYIRYFTGTATVANNFVGLGSTTSNDADYAIYLYEVSDVELIHNSILGLGSSPTYARAVYTDNIGGLVMLNNNIKTDGFYYGGIYIGSPVTVNQSDNNNFYILNGNYFGYSSSFGYFSNFTDFQSQTGTNANSLNVDPMYLADSDLHTCNPQLNGAGTPTSIIMDIDKDTRSILPNPDIGADEFVLPGDDILGADILKCPQDTVTLGDSLGTFVSATYGWNTLETTPTIDVAGSGAYYVQIQGTCGIVFDTVNVSFIPPPVADFNQINQQGFTVFYNQSTGGTSYLWDFGDGDTSTLFEPVHTYTTGGTYTVTLTVYNQCGDTSTYTLDVLIEFIGLENSEIANFNVFPNPSDGHFNITFSAVTSEEATISLYDVTGRLVYTQPYKTIAGKNNVAVNQQTLRPGTYIVKVKTDSWQKAVRIVKK